MVSTIQVELEDEVNIDTYKNNYFLSQLVIADSSLNRSVGFGYITQHLDKGSHVKFQKIQDYRDSAYKKMYLVNRITLIRKIYYRFGI